MKFTTIKPASLETAKRHMRHGTPEENLTRHVVFQSLEKSLRNFPMFGKIIVIPSTIPPNLTQNIG